jgi:hypothetical protein
MSRLRCPAFASHRLGLLQPVNYTAEIAYTPRRRRERCARPFVYASLCERRARSGRAFGPPALDLLRAGWIMTSNRLRKTPSEEYEGGVGT